MLDLCSRAFKRVVCFQMYFVPDLEVDRQRRVYAEKRWGIPVLTLPHWNLIEALANGIHCNDSFAFDGAPDFTLGTVYSIVRAQTGIRLIANGAKKADSRYRRATFATFAKQKDMLYPLAEWNKFDVLAYLKKREIEVLTGDKRNATGVDLSEASLLWLHDNHPADYRKLLAFFPYAHAVIKRRDWYGNYKQRKAKAEQA